MLLTLLAAALLVLALVPRLPAQNTGLEAAAGAGVETGIEARSGGDVDTGDGPPVGGSPAVGAGVETGIEARSGGDVDTGDGPPADDNPPADARQGVPYTYWDGADQRTVYLQIEPPSEYPTGAYADTGGGKVPEGAEIGSQGDQGQGGRLVFRSAQGEEMYLPGGVIVLLDPDWTAGQVDGFFDSNGIAPGLVSELGWIENGFVVATEPGMASLRLANSLFGQPGVEMSTPDWVTEEIAQ